MPLPTLLLALGALATSARPTTAPAPAYVVPRMHYPDTLSGRPCAKDPVIVSFGGRYLMYYSVPKAPGFAGWSIGIAESHNLLDWTKVGHIAFHDGAEANGYCAPAALVRDGHVHLLYQTYGNGHTDTLCHAVSSDGLHFTRTPNPFFHPTGAWTIGRAIDAEVVPFKGQLLVYWATRDPAFKIQELGVSSAPLDTDFAPGSLTQLNLDAPILAPRVPTPLDPPNVDLQWEHACIEAPTTTVRSGKLYVFYAGGYNNQPQQIGCAVTEDGLHLRRLNNGQPVLPVGAPGTWNDRESGHPGYFQDEKGNGWLFFQGNNAAESHAAHADTWYLSVKRVTWHPQPDGAELPTLSDP